jgi:hypothetical protein
MTEREVWVKRSRQSGLYLVCWSKDDGLGFDCRQLTRRERVIWFLFQWKPKP